MICAVYGCVNEAVFYDRLYELCNEHLLETEYEHDIESSLVWEREKEWEYPP